MLEPNEVSYLEGDIKNDAVCNKTGTPGQSFTHSFKNELISESVFVFWQGFLAHETDRGIVCAFHYDDRRTAWITKTKR
jgi:hypothetical protein